MTDKPQPIHVLIEGFDPEAVARALAPLTEALARMRFRNAARAALAACLDQDDEHAADLLDGLTNEQLYAIEAAASGLAIHASRLRAPMVDADQQQAEAEAAPLTVRMDNTRATFTPDEPRTPLADWERDLIEADAADEQPGDILAASRVLRRAGYAIVKRDALAKVERERDAADRRADCRERERDEEAECGKRFAGYLNAARDAAGASDWPSLPATITALRTRAETAESRADRAEAINRELAAALSDARRDRGQERDEEAALGICPADDRPA